MVPVIASGAHRYVRTGMAHHQHPIYRRIVGEFGQGGIDIGFQRYRLAAAPTLVRGDHEAAGAPFDPPGQSFGRKAAEDHGMNRAQARTGEHGEHTLDDHRHVDGDPVALTHPHRLECICHRNGFGVELPIGQHAPFAMRIVGLEYKRWYIG